ncbi:MAG: hypothetical protein O3A20_01015 [Planctomycetota bacterium]|nr:hypothetical protein [Planctomycetota bacterium]
MLTRLALPLLAATLAAPALAAQSTVSAGDQPEYSWHTDLFQGSAATSLADFRGKPILVDFWGTK